MTDNPTAAELASILRRIASAELGRTSTGDLAPVSVIQLREAAVMLEAQAGELDRLWDSYRIVDKDNGRLRTALDRHGVHAYGCAAWTYGSTGNAILRHHPHEVCTCGYSKVLEGEHG